MSESPRFSLGICASDSSDGLPSLVSTLAGEDYGGAFLMEKLIIVVSGCPAPIVSALEQKARTDYRILVITEGQRRGKAEAVNKIVENSAGEYVVLLNADAVPGRGAIRKLLGALAADARAGCISARPVFRESVGLLHGALSLMWSAHTTASLKLNHANTSNHSSDELIAVRRSLFPRLPAKLVNDGAYIGGRVKSAGYSVRFCDDATVNITVPTRFTDLLEQRRRIIFGHVQVWRKLGNPPLTIESLLFTDPAQGFRIVVSLLSRQPRLIFAIPFALVSETISALLAMFDSAVSSSRHAVWKRHGN
ncbi:MAG: glycosyltransferase [Nitrososphaerales archaeon]|nr:glycosyltransferase [Nitrososphaerales archaeon]